MNGGIRLFTRSTFSTLYWMVKITMSTATFMCSSGYDKTGALFGRGPWLPHQS